MPSRAAASYVNHWTSAAGALAGVLNAFGTALSVAEVSVLSGHAFRFAITASPDGAFGADGPSCFSTQSAFPLYERLGLRFQAFEAPPGTAEFGRVKGAAVEAMRRSVRHGRPAIAYGLLTAEFGIVFDADDSALQMSSTMSTQYGSRLPLSQWPAPGRNLPLRVFVPEKELRFRRAEALAAALAFAVHHARHGETGSVPGSRPLASGLPAFTHWADIMERSERDQPIAAGGHALCIQALIEARGEAAQVLGREAASSRSAGSTLLAGAAAAYAEESLQLSRLATLFPYPNGGDVRSAGGRRIGAAIAKSAGQAESRAVAQIAAYLAL